jgi:hypothetical protein
VKTETLLSFVVTMLLVLAIAWAALPAAAAELWIGGATVDITPDQPVPLDGHRHLRISNQVESPITATALALESRQGDKALDQALIYRKVTEAEAAEARREAAKYAGDPAQRWNYRWHQGVVERYEAQQAGTEGPYAMELHVLRLGDVAIATNDFELYTDYGVQIKARSPAVQTFVIQLAGSAGYLPTERAARGGGYGAVIQSSRVGPEGGQVLVDRTVEAIEALWKQ